jgi:hypothetical protein
VVPQRTVAIMAYGSLIHEPGPELGLVVVDRRPCRTPFPVEYGRASRRWGGGPVLVPHPVHRGAGGVLLVLNAAVALGQAVELLREREGLPGGHGVVEVDTPGPYLVIAACLPRNLPAPDMRPRALAARAVTSAASGPRNGIAYLRRACAFGVRTPLTDEYTAAVLDLTGAPTLEDAERRLVA